MMIRGNDDIESERNKSDCESPLEDNDEDKLAFRLRSP
jgi:hypothetical protein